MHLGAQSQAVRTRRNENILTGRKPNMTSRGNDAAVIFNVLSDQECRTATPDLDLAVIDDARLDGRSGELPGRSGAKIDGCPVRGRSDEARRANHGIGAKIKSRLV